MATSAKNGASWINICPDDDAQGVIVETPEGDRFVLSVQDAITACKSVENANRFVQQLGALFGRLNAWLAERPEKIDRAYLSLSDEGVDFTVVQRSKDFDPEVDEPLVELDINIASSPEFDLIKLDVMSLPYSPDESLRSFVRPSQTWVRQMPRQLSGQAHGDDRRSPRPSQS